jgi:hypothetical protein
MTAAFGLLALFAPAGPLARGASGEAAPRLHKVEVARDAAKARRLLDASGAVLLAAYDAFDLYRVDDATARALAADGARVRDDYDVVRLRRGAIDTSAGAPSAMALDAPDAGLFLVQFVAPPLDAWRQTVAAEGLEIVAPVPSNALLVRGDREAVERLASRSFVQWRAPFGRAERLDPSFDVALARRTGGDVAAAIQALGDAEGEALAARLAREATRLFTPVSRVGRFVTVRGLFPIATIESALDDAGVVNVEASSAPELHDERASVIASGALDAERKRPLAPAYLAWLAAHGFTGETFDFGIDFSDSGLDRGVVESPEMHPDLRGPDGGSRVAYAVNYVDGPNRDPADFYGHGTLNASIAVGYNGASEPPFVDADGYRYGLGVAPYARVGSSKIFDSGAGIFVVATYSEIAANAYRAGMRIGSNSWGAPGNVYTSTAQEFDAIVRDADPHAPGNQGYTVLFSSGNAYNAETIFAPGTAKNVITVGASENFRPAGVADGCGFGDDFADSADDVAAFSSAGPTADGRIKPDLVAPGTHVQGLASQNRVFNGLGLCAGEDGSKYFPAGQTLYSWTSGTSEAVPVVAGAAALVRAFTVAGELLPGGAAPSPAMVKAILAASAAPLAGARAGGSLPSARQGFGRVSLEAAFDDAARVVVDETVRFASTGESYAVEGSVGDPERPFRVALVWTDAPGLPSVAPQVNDLDLEVRVGETLYRGNAYTGFSSTPDPSGAPDSLNTIETVTVPAGVRGPFTVTVRAASIAGDGVPGDADLTDQDFALVVYNVDDGRWSPVEPPVVTSVRPKTANGGFKLLVFGDLLTPTCRVEVNALPVDESRVKYLERKGALKLRGSARALGLVRGDNTVVVVDGEARSEPFHFAYAP